MGAAYDFGSRSRTDNDGLRLSIDTPEEFQNYTGFFTSARIAATPLGYTLVGQTLNGSVYGTVYRGLQYLTSYDPVTCASMCNNIDYCASFNICEPDDDALLLCRDAVTDTGK